MALDPNIPLQAGKGVTPILNPFQLRAQAQELQTQAQQGQLAQMRLQDYAQQRQQGQSDAQQQHAVDDLMANALVPTPDGGFTYDRAKIQAQLSSDPALKTAWPKIAASLDASDAAIKKFNDAKKSALRDVASEVDGLGNTPAAFNSAAALYIKNGVFSRADIQPYLDAVAQDPSAVGKITSSLLGKKPDLMSVSPNATVIDKETHQPIFTAPPAPDAGPKPAAPGSQAAFLSQWAKEHQVDPVAMTTAQQSDALKDYRNATQRPPVLSGMNALYAQIDPASIAAGIRAGRQSPITTDLGRPAAAAVQSYLSKPGPNGEPPMDLASAQREWKAQINLNRTMNGSQQVRLDESIRSGLAMYDKIDELASDWNGKGWGPLSRANLKAATQGALGPDAHKAAIALTGEIGQLTSDVATIEQGGLTPTTESRAVAEKSLQDWWGTGTIQHMTAQGRYNMQIRHLARQTQDTMTPGNNPSQAPAKPATPEGGSPSPVAAAPPAPAGWKYVAKPGGGWTAVPDPTNKG